MPLHPRHRLQTALLLAACAAQTCCAQAPRRTSGLLAEGTRWQTPYYIIDSGREGPKVLITGGVHGNEPAGAWAADQVRHWPILRGTLIVVPRCNVPGLSAQTRRLPGEPDETRDLNRDFPKPGGPNEAKSTPAKALWALALRHRPNWHLDLHEGVGFRKVNKKTTGSSIIHFRGTHGAKLAEKMLAAVNATVTDADRAFVPLGPPASGSFAAASAHRLKAGAMILETTYKDQPLSRRVRQHRILCHRFLTELSMLAPAADVNAMTPPNRGRRDGQTVWAAVYNGAGTGNKTYLHLASVLSRRPGVATQPVGPEDIAAGVLKQFDVVVFPGGSGSKQAAALDAAGREIVRRFVRDGGGYVGICAGAYLATYRYSWSLKILDACTLDRKHWNRGTGVVKMEMTPAGRRIVGGPEGAVDVYYGQGPLLGPAEAPELPDYQVLAHYRGEIARKDAPKGVMVNTPAIVAGTFGRGRVICFSPHPEKAKSAKGLDVLVHRAVLWAGGGVSFRPR